jgi:hypothetical protein
VLIARHLGGHRSNLIFGQNNMNRIAPQICFILILQFAGLILKGQESKPFPTGERVVLFTDRALYVAGEQILFSASLQSLDGSDTDPVSRVLYCELITPDGNQISGNKYSINDNSTSGYLAIPDDIITGIYYLKAYTKYMRNYGPKSYHYTRIKIINPNRKDVQVVTSNNNSSQNISFDASPARTVDSFNISPDKSIYASGDTVNLLITGTESIQSTFTGLSLAVVPEFSESAGQIISPLDEQFENSGLFYPETHNLSITGKLIDNTTGKPLASTRINLSVLGKGSDFMAMLTDSSGRFFFSLPEYTGYRDLFLCTDNITDANPKILVDNDFCTIPVHIPTNNFTLTQKERETALNMAINVQLESYFKTEKISDSVNVQSENQAFYGKPNVIMDIDKYIQLPTLEDYFNELPTLVYVRKHQGEKQFVIQGDQDGLNVFNPLVLVDLVAIDNPALVLSIPPSDISRIEVVNSLYVKGDQIYGGIINIISKKGDFAGINLPSSGIFINYAFLADQSNYSGINHQLPHKPDTRNTLFWDPHLSWNKDHIARETFTLSGAPGSYMIILNGVNS